MFQLFFFTFIVTYTVDIIVFLFAVYLVAAMIHLAVVVSAFSSL